MRATKAGPGTSAMYALSARTTLGPSAQAVARDPIVIAIETLGTAPG